MNITKKLLSVLTTVLYVSALAVCPNTAYAVLDVTNYDKDTYDATVSSFKGKIPYEKEFVDYLNAHEKEMFGDNWENMWHIVHVYKLDIGCVIEDGMSRAQYACEEARGTSRRFSTSVWLLGDYPFRNNDELMEKYSLEEMNEFLTENGYNAHFDMEYYNDSTPYYCLKYDDNSEENKFSTFLALYKQFGAELEGFDLVEAGKIYTVEEITSPVNTNVTLKGDADLNGEVGLSDLVAVSKYNVNNAVFPFANELAFINADMNGDNKVDSLDESALVEYNLGKR